MDAADTELMAKAKTVYVCGECGATSPRWLGRCTSCNGWNTLSEERDTGAHTTRLSARSEPRGEPSLRLSEVTADAARRIPTHQPGSTTG